MSKPITFKRQGSTYLVVINNQSGGSLIQDVDGLYYWYPSFKSDGYIPEWVLRAILNRLHTLNSKHRKQMIDAISCG
jgi:hypothetical protein